MERSTHPTGQPMTEAKEYKYFNNDLHDAIQNNFMATIYDDLLKKTEFSTMLDVGCGNGLFGSYLKSSRTDLQLTGVDASEYALGQAQERGYDETSVIGDLNCDRLPFGDESFDFVQCKDVLEHLLDPEHSVKEIHRVLKKSGHFLMLVPNHFPLVDRIAFLFNSNLDTQSYFPKSRRWDYPHVRFFEFKELVEGFKSLGFELEKNYSGHFGRLHLISHLPKGKEALHHLAEKFPNQFASGFCLLLKK